MPASGAVNIKELFTPLSLAYLICDDGYYHKKENYVIIATNSYTKKEVDLLIDVLNNKFNPNINLDYVGNVPDQNFFENAAKYSDFFSEYTKNKSSIELINSMSK